MSSFSRPLPPLAATVPLHAGSLTLPTHSSTPSPLKTPPVTSESRMWSPTGEWATMPVKQA